MASRFYAEALGQSEGEPVDESVYRYPGPKPQTPETAILMLADDVASVLRDVHPSSQEEAYSIVQRVVERCVEEGQLLECGLGAHELAATRDGFVRMC